MKRVAVRYLVFRKKALCEYCDQRSLSALREQKEALISIVLLQDLTPRRLTPRRRWIRVS
jgi:hypothetical protein